MLPSPQQGFYVTAKDCDGIIRLLRFYETLRELVRHEYVLTKHREYFSESHDDRVEYHWDKYFWGRSNYYANEEAASQFAYVVIDHTERVVPLCELNRAVNELYAEWDAKRIWRPYVSFRTYFRRYYRRPKTTQEKRMWYAAVDQDERVPLRRRRSPRMLIDAWDDIPMHHEKSWKSLTKRRHQWKEKV